MESEILGFNGALDDYQVKGVEFAYGAKRSLICDEGGLGKTRTALAFFLYVRSKYEGENCLIICPSSSLHTVWENEIRSNTDFQPLVISGNKKLRERLYVQFGRDSNIMVVNYETMRMDYKNPAYKRAQVAIVDESSFIKNNTTVSAHAVRSVVSSIPWVVMLTATPVENNILELYSQVDVLYPGILGTIKDFKDRYCVIQYMDLPLRNRTVRMEKVVGAKNVQELLDRIKGFVLRRTPEDVKIRYPVIKELVVKLDMSASQRSVYNDLRMFILKNAYTAKKLTLLTRYGYMLTACNFPSIITGRSYEPGESPKYEYLRGMLHTLKNNREKVVIFSRSRRTIVLLEKLLLSEGFKCTTVTGREDKIQKAKNQSVFKSSTSGVDIILINIAGAKSLNLQEARFLIFFDLFLNPEVNHQAVLRIMRRNQKSDVVFIITMVLKNSAEERLLEMLKGKKKVTGSFLEGVSLSRRGMYESAI